jgi:DNA polymerase epsilon subunit 1
MNINGIYETKIPLQFRAILKLGSTCNVKSLVSSTRINADQMERIPHSEMPFIPLSTFRILYLYELTVDNRTAFALFNPSASQAQLFIIHRAKIDAPNVNAIYRKEYAK